MLSVGVDIGSSTSHLVFSRIVLERLDSRYVVTERETFYALRHSADALLRREHHRRRRARRLHQQGIRRRQGRSRRDRHRRADPDRRRGAADATRAPSATCSPGRPASSSRSSAGDSLETVMAAYGSGAAARSIRDECVVMNVDVGGGTSKIAVCAEGKVIDLAARRCRRAAHLPRTRRQDHARRGRRPALRRGARHRSQARRHADARSGPRLAGLMADKLFEAMRGGAPHGAGREPAAHRSARPPRARRRRFSSPAACRSSSTATRAKKFGDLGPLLAAEIRARVDAFCPRLEPSLEGIRATVVGASQYTIQFSGSTIYVRRSTRCRSATCR